MIINEKLVKYNFSSRNGEKIKYIVVHDTGNTSEGANANAHYNYFNSKNQGASAHYFVDDTQVLRIIKDEDKSWHCGDGKGKYGITNENSIGVEMCINKDGDFNRTYQNTVELVKHLMNTYNIPIGRVVRHYDASRKICPNIWKNNNWDKWTQFKIDLERRNYDNYIIKSYKHILGRSPDSEGFNYWNNKIKSDSDFGNFIIELFESEEYSRLKG